MTPASAAADTAYQRLKAALLDGSLAHRERIEIAEQARVFEMSVTPVREAAMRLLGEGLIEFGSGGLRAVPLTETRVRNLLSVNHRLYLSALSSGDGPPAGLRLELDITHGIEAATRTLFEAVARSTGNAVLVQLIAHLSDALAPIRHVEPLIFPDAAHEVIELAARLAEVKRARTHAIGRYHRRRLDRARSLSWAARRAPNA